MKLTGPEGRPPPASFSLLDRRVERSEPVPEPYLKSIASDVASRMMSCMSSATLWMKQADQPVAVIQADVEPDGRVERAILIQAERRQLVIEALGVVGGGEVTVVASP